MAPAYALFKTHPKLAANLPQLLLGNWPTPLQPLPRLAAEAGLPFRVFVKRDDLSSPVYGGNKVRKLELILGRAAAGREGRFAAAGRGRRPPLVVTAGGLGSNHVVATAALAARAGFETRGLLYCQPVTAHVRRNLLAGAALGADLRFVRDYPGLVTGYVAALAKGVSKRARPPLLIMPGGSSPLSSVGYANAVLEMVGQLRAMGERDPAAIFVPAGTGGTAAGLLAGVTLAGLETTVVAVRVVAPGLLGEAKIRGLAQRTLGLLSHLDPDIAWRITENAIRDLRAPGAGGRLEMEGGFLGEAYGFATDEARAAVGLAAHAVGLDLETTYTGKALAALLAAGRERSRAPVGGPPAGATGKAAPPRPWVRQALEGHPVIFVNTYSSVDPAGIAIGAEPPELVARLPESLRWCFNGEPVRGCRCALAAQNRRFCQTVAVTGARAWEETSPESR